MLKLFLKIFQLSVLIFGDFPNLDEFGLALDKVTVQAGSLTSKLLNFLEVALLAWAANYVILHLPRLGLIEKFHPIVLELQVVDFVTKIKSSLLYLLLNVIVACLLSFHFSFEFTYGNLSLLHHTLQIFYFGGQPFNGLLETSNFGKQSLSDSMVVHNGSL